MKKIKTLLMLMLMLLAIGCMQQTSKQDIEKQGQEKMKALEEDGFSRIHKMIVDMLKYPESYQPISTHMSIVTNKMLIYDSFAFVNLRDLQHALEDFNEKYGNDTLPQSAWQEMEDIETLGNFVRDRINAINNLPAEFEGIDVFHQFYAKDHPDNVVKKGYHFIVHKNDKITLLCSHEDFLHVQTLIQQWFCYPFYSKANPDSLDNFLNMKQERLQREKKVNNKKTSMVKTGK